ncbi:cation diffusion facilitator family transporter [Desulfosporosinus orientis DSM 765]|uniref:Cation diffusion facilitator family transporter n=1 Tax=Desulfosporosinus orientis (strain ATCC 19365 / DSM 765 / NCIMB 8382 / VKM B-1628 / Singapore I) TaxID=768706 RepID=G7W8F0_DESOD|nr:cation diffusion facilitator family transporter [Desulfosporosinus orientis]AET67090.1 cation diffusion facilitator family transporter [Desulfosporosinus orientis DSM 765]
MSKVIELIKKGNASSLYAVLGNLFLVIFKGIAAFFSGSGAMFAEAMHTAADAVNQLFVFIGSILAERKPTSRFPSGFGRLINVFCMGAVIVITLMAYETVLEGIELFRHPAAISSIWLIILSLGISMSIDGYVLHKAMREIVHESRTGGKGFRLLITALRNVNRASPATRLVFFEDLVATAGAILALGAILISHFTPVKILDGIAAVIIGIMMGGVAFRVGYDNMVGLIGVSAPKEVEEKVSKIILSIPEVTDINKMRILQEGRFYHVESYIELSPGLSLAKADTIKVKIRDQLIASNEVTDVTLGIIEDNGVQDWPAKYH